MEVHLSAYPLGQQSGAWSKEGRFLSCGEDSGDVDGRRERLVHTSPAKTALSTNVCGSGCLATVVEEGRPQS